MQTRNRRDSGVSSSSGSSKGSKRRIRTRNGTANQNSNICNGSPLPHKKLKRDSNTSIVRHEDGEEEAEKDDKHLTVPLTDILKDERLCSKYSLHEKVDGSSINDCNSEMDSLSNEETLLEANQLCEKRQIVMQDKLLFTIIKRVDGNNGQVLTNNTNYTVSNEGKSACSESNSGVF